MGDPDGGAAWASLLLLPLYLSQRRDLKRLVAWQEREPEHAAADVAASEAILDRAETEIEVPHRRVPAPVEPGRAQRGGRRSASPASAPRSSG